MKKSKRFFGVLLTVCLLTGMMPGVAVAAEVTYPVTGGNLYFDTETGTITDCDTSVTEANIPASINGVAVTAIGEKAFEWCMNLNNVVIPDSVLEIEDNAFSDCRRLSSVTISDSVIVIGNFAFYDCYSLTSVAIPDNVTTIGHFAFSDCFSLDNIIIPNGVTEIGAGAFSDCKNLNSVILPDNIDTINSSTFFYCSNLSSIRISNEVTEIGAGAFCECNNLTNIYYNGSEKEWNDIIVHIKNEPLTSAIIHYNSVNTAAPTPAVSEKFDLDKDVSEAVPAVIENPASYKATNTLIFLKNHMGYMSADNYMYTQMAEEVLKNKTLMNLYMSADWMATGWFVSGKMGDIIPTSERYKELLLRLFIMYEQDTADMITQKNIVDNTRTFTDKTLEVLDIATGTAGQFMDKLGLSDDLENVTSMTLGILMTEAKDLNNYIESASALQTQLENYTRFQRFLERLEESPSSDDELKKAAGEMRRALSSGMQLKMESISQALDENFQNDMEFFFSDLLYSAVSLSPLYETDETFRWFFDKGKNLSKLYQSWKLGDAIGRFVGNVWTGGEDLNVRMKEIFALRCLSAAMQEVLVADTQNLDSLSETDIDNILTDVEMLAITHLRGEYCFRNIITEDSGRLGERSEKVETFTRDAASWHKKHNHIVGAAVWGWLNEKTGNSAQTAEQWYENQGKILGNTVEAARMIRFDDEEEEVSVSDAYSDFFWESYMGENVSCYHIPKINSSDGRFDDINRRMYDKFYGILENEVYTDTPGYHIPVDMAYSWGKKGEIISIVVGTMSLWDRPEYYVFNISSVTGREIILKDLVALYGLSEDGFYDLVRKSIDKYWEVNKEIISHIGQRFYEDAVKAMLDEENVKEAIPYISPNGELNIILEVFPKFGGDTGLRLLSTSGEIEENFFNCKLINHSNELQ